MSVLFIGPLPPPVHGQSLVTLKAADLLVEAGVTVHRIDTSGALPQKLKRHVTALYAILTSSGSCYISVNSNTGIWLTVILAAVARLRLRPLVLHHHSFGNVREPSAGMTALALAAGRRAIHLVLGNLMAEQLRAAYGALNISVLGNSGFVPDYPARTRPPGRELRIGFIGNLTLDKGLDSALALGLALKTRRVPFVLSIAGPVQSQEAAAALEQACIQFGPQLEYRGPVYGEEKALFFKEIDVLLFPSRYRNEAVPLTVLESLSAGVPVISTNSGCLPEIVVEGSGQIVDYEFTGAELALDAIAHDLERYSAGARRRYETMNMEFYGQFSELVAILSGR